MAANNFIQPDHLGSVRHVTNATGSVLAYNDHNPFGNPVTTYGIESSFGFTGEQEDASGLLFLRARYYDAETGRFLSQYSWGGDSNHPTPSLSLSLTSIFLPEDESPKSA